MVFSAGPQGYNFQPLMQGLETVRAQKNQNALLQRQDAQAEFQKQQYEDTQQHRNALLQLQQQKLARGPERPWWAGPNGQVDPAMLAKTAAGRAQNNVTVNQGYEKEYDKKLAGENAKYFIEGQKGAMTANRDLSNLRVMESALKDPNLYTGTAGQTVQSLKKAASTLFGVPVQGVASGEVVQNLSKEIALGLKDNLPGPLSDSDRRFLVDMAPGLQNSPEGNQRILELGMLQKRYQIARGQAARDYSKANNGKIDAGFYGYLEKVENEYAQKFSGMVNQMRSGGQEQPTRSPLAGIPQLQSLEQYRAAPSGTKFVAPDGSVRVKP